MKNLIFKIFTLIVLIVALNSGSFAQDKPDNENLNAELIEKLQEQQFNAKKNDNINEVLNLQVELDNLTGSVTERGIEEIEIENMPAIESALDSLVSRMNYVSGIASTSEQRGLNNGRVWTVCVGGSTSSSIADTVYIYYSDNARIWTQFAKFSLSPQETLNKNEIDCEIIENHTGDKYLYVVYGTNNTAFLGRKKVRYSVSRISGAFSTVTGFLSWPGDVVTNNYYRPRITSDNAQYPSGAYIYISASLDSLTGASTHRSCTKIAQSLNPYTTSPSITYKTNALFFVFNTGTTEPFSYSDLAYFNDGASESVIFAESKMGIGTDTSKIKLNLCLR